MNDPSLRRRLILSAAAAIFCGFFLARVTSILFTYAATDILYSESLLPTVLSYLRQIFSACAFGAGIAALTAAESADNRSARAVFLIFTLLQLADVLTAFAVDAFSHAVEEALLGIAALFNLGDWLFSSLLMLGVWGIIRLCMRRGKSVSAALMAGATVSMIGRLLLQLFSVFRFLIEVEFSPYTSEILQIAGEILQVLVMSGGAVWLCAMGIHALLAKIRPAS